MLNTTEHCSTDTQIDTELAEIRKQTDTHLTQEDSIEMVEIAALKEDEEISRQYEISEGERIVDEENCVKEELATIRKISQDDIPSEEKYTNVKILTEKE